MEIFLTIVVLYILMIPISSWIIGKFNPDLGKLGHQTDFAVVAMACIAWPLTLCVLGPFYLATRKS